MNKRSAIAVAGGLTGALVSGLVGYSVRLHTQPVAAAPATSAPIVKTQTRTITIHRKPKHPVHTAAPPRTVVVHRPTRVIHLPSGSGSGTTVHQTGGSSHTSTPPTHHTGGSTHSPQPPTHHTGGSTHSPGPPTHHTGGSTHGGGGGGEHDDGGGDGGGD